MDPLLLKQLGERELDQRRADAAHDRAVRVARPAAPRGGSIVASLRRTTGGALITVGARLRGEPRAF